MKMRLSAKTNDYGRTHFYLDDFDNIWTQYERFAEFLWHELGLPSEDGEHWIKIEVLEE